MGKKDRVMKDQIFFCQPNRVKLPAALDVFTYGNTGYLSIHSDDHAVDVALAGNAAAVVMALRSAADEMEKKLFLRQHQEKTRRAQLQSIHDWDWLTPEMVIQYFEQSSVLRNVAGEVREVLSKILVAPPQAALAASQLDADLAIVQPYIEQVVSNGKVNKSEIARLLKIKPSGPSNWTRITAIAEAIAPAESRQWRVDGEEKVEAA